MKFATLRDGSRDGCLLMVDRELDRAIRIDDIAPNLQYFLENWRDSRFNTLRQGYILLTQLPTLAFYYQPENWNDQIYPGPPQHIPS